MINEMNKNHSLLQGQWSKLKEFLLSFSVCFVGYNWMNILCKVYILRMRLDKSKTKEFLRKNDSCHSPTWPFSVPSHVYAVVLPYFIQNLLTTNRKRGGFGRHKICMQPVLLRLRCRRRSGQLIQLHVSAGDI